MMAISQITEYKRKQTTPTHTQKTFLVGLEVLSQLLEVLLDDDLGGPLDGLCPVEDTIERQFPESQKT